MFCIILEIRRNYSDVLHQTVDTGHYDIIEHLVKELKFDVNAYDLIGCTPLHCVPMNDPRGIAKLLVESGACVFAETLYDRETVTFGCEMENDFDSAFYKYMKEVEGELGVINEGKVYAAFDFQDNENESCSETEEIDDELHFIEGEELWILSKGNEKNTKWWFARNAQGDEGFIPRNLISLYPKLI